VISAVVLNGARQVTEGVRVTSVDTSSAVVFAGVIKRRANITTGVAPLVGTRACTISIQAGDAGRLVPGAVFSFRADTLAVGVSSVKWNAGTAIFGGICVLRALAAVGSKPRLPACAVTTFDNVASNGSRVIAAISWARTLEPTVGVLFVGSGTCTTVLICVDVLWTL